MQVATRLISCWSRWRKRRLAPDPQQPIERHTRCHSRRHIKPIEGIDIRRQLTASGGAGDDLQCHGQAAR